MKKLKPVLILLNLLILLVYFNWSVWSKEQTLKHGRLVLLELAPVDPRALMQGDYMRLNFAANLVNPDTLMEKRGFCILRPDSAGVFHRIRFQPGQQPLQAREVAIRYFYNGNPFSRSVHIGAESFFFEEGQAGTYAEARFGALRVDDQGNSILIGLCGADRSLIRP